MILGQGRVMICTTGLYSLSPTIAYGTTVEAAGNFADSHCVAGCRLFLSAHSRTPIYAQGRARAFNLSAAQAIQPRKQQGVARAIEAASCGRSLRLPLFHSTNLAICSP